MDNSTRDPTTEVPCSSVSQNFYTIFTTVPVFVLVLIGLIGIAGNSLVLFIIIKHRDMRTVTNFFVANLAVTDIALLLMCTFPEALVTYNLQNGWILGDFMCRATGYMQNVTVQATCCTLTAMTIDRYYLIVHAVKSRHNRTVVKAVVICVSIWLGSALVHLPKFAFTKTQGNNYDNTFVCNVHFPSKEGERIYSLFLLLATYVIPLVIILYCYAQILVTVWRKTSAGTESAQAQSRALRRKRKITRMVFIVVILFALCWLPIQSFNTWYTFDTDTFNILFCKYAQTIFTIGVIIKSIAHSNSIVNPFVYAFTTTSFKKYYKKVFLVCFPSKAPATTSVSMSMTKGTKTERLTSTKEESSM